MLLVSRASRPALALSHRLNLSPAATSRFALSHHAAIQKDGRAPRVAIVGSGPAGFYTAQKVMRDVKGSKIDMYEQLPTPFGLVRFGVAPDHPEVKNVQDSFDETASSPDYQFIGNVNLGHDLPLPLLANHYDAVVFAYGASKDRRLGLEGEDRPHIYSARAFVGWYNGLPKYRNLNPDLQAGDTATVIGQGNVALDVARTLLSNIDHLDKTDITDYALQALSESKIKHVHVVGRRGPVQAAFTIKEVRELLQMDSVSFEPIPSDLFPPDLSKFPRPRRRILELLKKGSTNKAGQSKSWSLNFLLAPQSLNYTASDSSALESVTFTRTKLAEPYSVDSAVSPTSETVTFPTSTLFRSIGYRAQAIPGMADIGASFDERKGTLQHDGQGRIIPIGTETQLTTSKPRPPALYCAGWVKRGPTGVIASTMTDAHQTAEALVDDWKRSMTEALPEKAGWKGVKQDAEAQNLKLNPVHWDGWQRIDEAEKSAGEQKGKPREKFGHVEDMLKAGGAVAV